jgi:hypothetical protein
MPRVRLVAAAGVVIAFASAGIAWFVIRGDDAGTPRGDLTAAAMEKGSGTGPVALSATGVRTLAGAFSQPIYWAGARRGYMYALRQTSDGKVYVRYLPPGVRVDDARSLLVVATYRLHDALAAINEEGQEEDAVRIRLPAGGLAYYRVGFATNIFLAYPGMDYKVEVFDPSPQRARRLVSSGQITPVR